MVLVATTQRQLHGIGTGSGGRHRIDGEVAIVVQGRIVQRHHGVRSAIVCHHNRSVVPIVDIDFQGGRIKQFKAAAIHQDLPGT